MGLNTICLNNIHSDDDDFDDDNPEIIINDRLKAWCNRYKQCKTYKKDISKELMALAWHPTKWRDYCMTKGLNKIEPFYIHEKQSKMSQLVKL